MNLKPMHKVKSEQIHIRITKSKKTKIHEICDLLNVSTSELITSQLDNLIALHIV